MNEMAWYDWWRLLNVAWGILLMLTIARNARTNWDRYTGRMRDYTVVLLGFCLLAAGGGIESILAGTGYRYGVFATTLLLLLLTRAALRKGELIK